MSTSQAPIDLTPKQRELLAAKAKQLGVAASVVDELLGSEGMPVEPTTHGDGENGSLGLLLPPDEWIASFRRVADELAVSVPDVDDSRESIYGDR